MDPIGCRTAELRAELHWPTLNGHTAEQQKIIGAALLRRAFEVRRGPSDAANEGVT